MYRPLAPVQELKHAFPLWGESIYTEWIETYSSQEFEVYDVVYCCAYVVYYSLLESRPNVNPKTTFKKF